LIKLLEVKYELAKRNLIITEEDIQQVKRWKKHYGFRVIGKTEEEKIVINGLDVYKMTTSVGLDLELVLIKLEQNNCIVDWISYIKSAMIEKWPIKTIITKIRFPIIEAYGTHFWEECEYRIKLALDKIIFDQTV
jgi:hypothetical protein